MIYLLLAVFSLLFSGQPGVSFVRPMTIQEAVWDHRLVAYVVSSDAERRQLEESIERWSVEIEDRDMLLVSLGDVELESDHSMTIGEDEKAMWRQLWKLDESESRFVLIGKDGGAKAFQRNELDLTLFFDLIDTMPMRLAEIRERTESGGI